MLQVMVTLQVVLFFLLTLAVTSAFPGHLAVMVPFCETVNTLLLLVLHLIFLELPPFARASFLVAPCSMDSLVPEVKAGDP